MAVTTRSKTKQTKQLNNAAAKAHKQLVTTKNKGLDRKAILSSGRELPSSHGWQNLSILCEVSYSMWKDSETKAAEKVPELTQRFNRLLDRYKRSPQRLKDQPNNYILPQRVKALKLAERTAEELHRQHCAMFKRSTGRDWKPKIEPEKPLEDNQRTGKRAKDKLSNL